MNFNEVTDKKIWNDFALNCEKTDILQSWEWGETKRIEGYVPYRFLLCKNQIPNSKFQDTNVEEIPNIKYQISNILLGAQVLVKSVKFFGKLAYIPHGPVFRDTEGPTIELLKEFQENLIRWARENGVFVIEAEPKIVENEIDEMDDVIRANYYSNDVLTIYKSNGWIVSGRNVQPKYKLLMDITRDDESIMSQMKKNTRYNIKYAEKQGVEVKRYELDDPQIGKKIKEFHKLVEDMQERASGYPVRPLRYFEKFVEEFRDSKNVALFEVSFQGDLIAMNISEYTPAWASSFYAGSNRLHEKLKAPYLLRWASIQEAKSRGCKIYDFWGIIPESKQHAGYSQNKLSFGGKRMDFVGVLTYPISFKAKLYEIALKLQKVYLKVRWGR